VLDITISIDEGRLRAVERRGDEEEEPPVAGGKVLLTEVQWQARLKEKQQGESSSKAGSGKGGSKSPPRGQRKKKAVDDKDNCNTCLNCGKKGHWAKDCRAPRKEQTNLTREDDEESLLMAQVCELEIEPISSEHGLHLHEPTAHVFLGADGDADQVEG
jgi:hypothetical protein